MKIVAIVAIGNVHPMLSFCLEKTRILADKLYVRLDKNNMSILDLPKLSYDNIMLSYDKWNRFNFREDLLQMIHRSDINPDIIIHLDHDEVFDGDVMPETKRFYESEYDMMFFDYHFPMPTDDGRYIPELKGKPYPSMAHCKVFRWRDDLSFKPYMGLAQPTQYANKPYFKAKTKIKHYCMWTKQMEEKKKKWVMGEYGVF